MLYKKRSLRFGLTAAICGFVLTAVAGKAIVAVRANSSVFHSDFEDGFTGWNTELCCDHSAEIVSSPKRAGDKAIKFTLKKDDPLVSNSKRAELKQDRIPANAERWYGFSVYLPSDYKSDPSYEIITQWHAQPDFDLGEDWRSPPLSLLLTDGAISMHRRWDADRVTKNNKPGSRGGTETINLGAYKTGAWTDFVVHVKWSHQSDGLIEVWKDGTLVVRKTGPNTYNDEIGTFFKLGMYKPHWKHKPEASTTTQRVIYFDEVRIGDASANYQSVVPQSNSVAARPF